MYPTISDLFRDLFGFGIPLPIQSFGFFVAIAFLAASYFLAKELKRKTDEGFLKPTTKKKLEGEPAKATDLLLSAVIGFVIGYKLLYLLLDYGNFVNTPHEYILSLKGNIFGGLIGAALSTWLKYRATEKAKLPKPEWREYTIEPQDHVSNMTIIAAFAGLLGAKIFHNLENPAEFIANPVDALISFSGLTMYGGLICGSIAEYLYLKKHKLSVRHAMDAGAPSLMLAYGIGRIGCQLAGDGDWGISNTAPMPSFLSFLPDWMWSFNYPHNVINEGIAIPGCVGKHCYMLAEPAFPTPFYESIISIGLFFVLWSIRKKIAAPGMLFSIYLIFNGFERFWIEKIRVNSLYHIAGYDITQAEIISSVLMILGCIGVWWFRRMHKQEELLKPNL